MKIHLLPITLLLLTTACSHEYKKPDTLGQYVYVEPNDTYHSDLDCPVLKSKSTSESWWGNSVDPIPINKLYFGYHNGHNDRICPGCFSEDTYHQLKTISDNNR